MVRASKASSRGGQPQLSYATMSECSKLYVHALLDPWDVPSPPCVPDNITLPSYKFAARGRYTLTVGAAGLGFATVDPYLFGTQFPAARFSGPGYQSAVVDISANFFVEAPSDSPYPLDSFDPKTKTALSLRVVGFGLRARYTGSEMSRSGQIVAFREPVNSIITSPAPVDVFLANREAVTVPSDRKWHSAVWRPATPRDLAYEDNFSLFTQFEPSILLVVSGAVPGTSFEIDAVGWYEVIGNTLPHLSRSHSDPLGMSVVMAGLSSKQPTASPQSSVNSFIREATEIANTTLSFISSVKPIVELGMEIASIL